MKAYFSNLGHRSIARYRPRIIDNSLEAAAHGRKGIWFPGHVKDTTEYLAEISLDQNPASSPEDGRASLNWDLTTITICITPSLASRVSIRFGVGKLLKPVTDFSQQYDP